MSGVVVSMVGAVMLADRLETLVVARAFAAGGQPLGELIAPLARFAPPELTTTAWRDRLAEVVGRLRAAGALDAEHRLRDAGELARRIGKHAARAWPELADRVLPALALGVAADDAKLRARLASRDAWAAAIVGRTLGLWLAGSPPSLPAVCDALIWRELELTGKPKRCPPEVRAVFARRQLASAATTAPAERAERAERPERPEPPERWIRVLAAREVGAPRPELRALRDALVRGWLADRTPGHGAAAPVARSFARDVLDATRATTAGQIGDRKVFASSVWHQLRCGPRYADLALADFKARLVAAHRAGELVLARADYVAAMDPELVAASEIAVDGATFHFIVKGAT